MSLKINHQTNAISATEGTVYIDGNMNTSGVLTGNYIGATTLSSELLGGTLAPNNFPIFPDMAGYGLSPTFIPWLNTLVVTTTITTNITSPTALTANKRYLLVVAVGGGGGGQAGISGNLTNPAGGFAGTAAYVLLDLHSYATNAMPKYTATIGAGGTGGTTTTPTGVDGGTTSFSIYIPTAIAGYLPLYTLDALGGYAASNPGDGMYNYTGVVGNNVMFKDGVMGTGTNGTTLFAGQGGQASIISVGANGGNAAATPTGGASAAANTGAGGGGGALYNTARSNGGAGGSGVIKLYYI